MLKSPGSRRAAARAEPEPRPKGAGGQPAHRAPQHFSGLLGVPSHCNPSCIAPWGYEKISRRFGGLYTRGGYRRDMVQKLRMTLNRFKMHFYVLLACLQKFCNGGLYTKQTEISSRFGGLYTRGGNTRGGAIHEGYSTDVRGLHTTFF